MRPKTVSMIAVKATFSEPVLGVDTGAAAFLGVVSVLFPGVFSALDRLLPKDRFNAVYSVFVVMDIL